MLDRIPEFQEFDKYMMEKKFSQNSIEAYRKDINDFFIFINYKELNEITTEDFLEFIKDLKKCYSNNTINRKIMSLKGYFKYFYKKKILKTPIFENIKSLTPQKKKLEYLSKDELERLRGVIGDDPKEYRDKLIFDILGATGMLVSDLLEVRIEQLEEENYKYIVQRKGTRIVKIKLEKDLVERIKYFISEVRDELRNKNTKLFSSISRQNFRARLIKYGKDCGIERDIYPNMIRNSVLKNLLEKEGAHVVKDIMGYTTIKNTSLYQRRNTKAIREIYRKIAIGDN